jgi:hypothetical protein
MKKKGRERRREKEEREGERDLESKRCSVTDKRH